MMRVGSDGDQIMRYSANEKFEVNYLYVYA